MLDRWLAASMGMLAARRISTCIVAAARLIVTLCDVARQSIYMPREQATGQRREARGFRLKAEGLRFDSQKTLIGSRGGMVRGAGEHGGSSGRWTSARSVSGVECEVCGVKCAVSLWPAH